MLLHEISQKCVGLHFDINENIGRCCSITYSTVLNSPVDNVASGIFGKLARAEDKAISNNCLVVKGPRGRSLITVNSLAAGGHFAEKFSIKERMKKLCSIEMQDAESLQDD